MTKKRKKQTKARVVYRETTPSYYNDLSALTKKKQEMLEPYKKEQTKKEGFFGKLGVGLRAGMATAGINREISSRKRMIQQDRQLIGLKKQVQIEKLRKELKETRKGSQEDIFGEIGTVNTKAISEKDIFG